MTDAQKQTLDQAAELVQGVIDGTRKAQQNPVAPASAGRRELPANLN